MSTAREKLLIDARDARATAAKARRVARQVTFVGDSENLRQYAVELDAKAVELEQRAKALETGGPAST